VIQFRKTAAGLMLLLYCLTSVAGARPLLVIFDGGCTNCACTAYGRSLSGCGCGDGCSAQSEGAPCCSIRSSRSCCSNEEEKPSCCSEENESATVSQSSCCSSASEKPQITENPEGAEMSSPSCGGNPDDDSRLPRHLPPLFESSSRFRITAPAQWLTKPLHFESHISLLPDKVPRPC